MNLHENKEDFTEAVQAVSRGLNISPALVEKDYYVTLVLKRLKERLMDKTEVNMNVLNKVIAFKLLRILRDNGFIEDGKYANIERKSIQYGESIISQNKLVGR